jgi:hypothetical protein
MATTWPRCCSAADDAQLLGRVDPGEHRDRVDDGVEFRVGQVLQLAPVDGPGPLAIAGDAERTGDGQPGRLVVAGHHHRAHAGGLALRHRVGHLRPWWVELADEAAQHDATAQGGEGGQRQVGIGPDHLPHRQHPHRLRGHRLDGGVQRPVGHLVEATQRRHLLGCALDEDPRRAGAAVRGGHQLGARVERQLTGARRRRPLGVRIEPGLVRQRHQRDLGRVSHRLPSLVRPGRRPQRGVVAQRRRDDQLAQLGPTRRALDLPGWVVADASHRRRAPVRQPQRGRRHLVAGERAGLVGADDRGRAQRLHRGQAAHHHLAPGHPLHADGQGDRHRHRQPLGDEADHLADRQHDDGPQRQPARQAERHHQHEHAGRPDHDVAAKLVDPSLQRRRRLHRRPGQRGDPPELGPSPGRHHHRAGPSAGEVGPREQQRAPLRQHRVGGDRGRRLVDRHRLAGQRTLGDLGRHRLDHPRVGGDRVAGVEHQDVSHHHLGRRHVLRLTVPHHPGLVTRQRTQRAQRGLGPALLHRADHRVERHHHADHHRVPDVAERGRQRRRRQQQVDERAGELRQHHHGQRTPRRLRQRVGTALRQAPRRLGCAQTSASVDLERRRHRGGVERVPGQRRRHALSSHRRGAGATPTAHGGGTLAPCSAKWSR